MRRAVPRWNRLLVCGAVLSAATLVHGQAAGPEGKAQLPADQRAYKAATATVDPEKRLLALRQFIRDYPKSKRVDRAQSLILTVLVKQLPDRAAEIDAQARLLVKQGGKGQGKWREEGYIADELAGEGPRGVDLDAAETWAADAARHTGKVTEASYAKDQAKLYKKYKMTPALPAAQHKDYEEMQAGAIIPLADVYLHRGRLPEAGALLEKAYTLDPMIDEVSSLRGQLALEQHRDGEALTDFERAQLLGELRAPWTARMMELYKAEHGGSDAGFVTAMDAEYATLYPPTFTPAAKPPVPAGHTVLLELFTGSACPPCVGGDLAVEGLLKAYPRSQVVALAFDQHIPEPDPLANGDSVARATEYGVTSTPSYVIDGKQQPFYGGGREASEELYGRLSKVVDAQLGRPGAVELRLTALLYAGNQVQAEAEVSVGSEKAVQAALTPPPPPPPAVGVKPASPIVPGGATGAAPGAAGQSPAAPQLVLHFALVEDEVRYSGENGVRFHRMVVRALDAGGNSKPLAPGASLRAKASFQPEAIAGRLKTYLTDYQDHNDRFGKVEFLSLDTTIEPTHLFVAAWVQDAATRRVLQAALAPVVGAR